MDKYKELDKLYDKSRTLYTDYTLPEEEILLSSFIELKEIIDKMAISISKYDVERFFDYMVFDYVFLSKPLESKVFSPNKYITLDIYPNYQIFVYKFSDIELEDKLETRIDFVNFVNNNKLSIQELKVTLLHLYGIVYPMYMHKNVSIKNELDIFSKFIEIKNFDMDKYILEINSNSISIDNIIIVHDSKRDKDGLIRDKLLIKIKDIS